MKMHTGNHILCRNMACPGFPGAGHAVWGQVETHGFSDVVTGAEPELNTQVAVFRDDGGQALFIRFTGKDEGVQSGFRLHDEPLYREDVFEAFIADENDLNTYKELEASPYDVRFDGMIRFEAEGKRTLSMAYDIEGWQTETVFLPAEQAISSVWKIPYSAFSRPPRAGTHWRVNFFRIDHSARGISLQAWQATGEPNFHVPRCFGYLDFE